MRNFAYERAPTRWVEFYGQEQVTKQLKQFIEENEIPRSIFVSGEPGTGKTSLIRLFLKSMRCLNRQPGEHEPCNECAACKDGDERLTTRSLSDVIWVQPGKGYAEEETLTRQFRAAMQLAAQGQRHTDNPEKDYLWIVLDEFQAFPANLRTELLLKAELEIPNNNVCYIFITMDEEKLPLTDLIALKRRGAYLYLRGYTQQEIIFFLQKCAPQTPDETCELIAQFSHRSIGLALANWDSINRVDDSLSLEAASFVLRACQPRDRQRLWNLMESHVNFAVFRDFLEELEAQTGSLKLAQQLELDILNSIRTKPTDIQLFALSLLNQFQQHYQTVKLFPTLLQLYGHRIVSPIQEESHNLGYATSDPP